MGGARDSCLNVAGQRVHSIITPSTAWRTRTNFNTYLFLPSIDALQEFN
jgi:hypothetical protein